MTYIPPSLNVVLRLHDEEVEAYLRQFGEDFSLAEEALKSMLTCLDQPVKPMEVAEDITFLIAMDEYVARGDLPLPEEVFDRFSVPEDISRYELGRLLPWWRNQARSLVQVLRTENRTKYSDKIVWLRLRAISNVAMRLLDNAIGEAKRHHANTKGDQQPKTA